MAGGGAAKIGAAWCAALPKAADRMRALQGVTWDIVKVSSTASSWRSGMTLIIRIDEPTTREYSPWCSPT